MAGLADAFAQIESSGNPLAWNTLPGGRRSRYRGLYQFGPDQERRYGITDWTDPGQQNSAFERHIGTLRGDLTRRLGRAPEDWELYFGHQQGPSGSTALLSAGPGTPAWRAIRRYYGSDALARQAITGNIPSGHALYGRDPETIMASDFAQMWRERFGRTGRQGAPFGAPTPVSAPSPVGGPPPQPGGQPGTGLLPGFSAALAGFSPFGTAHAGTPGGAPKGERDNPFDEPEHVAAGSPVGRYFRRADGGLYYQGRGGAELVAGPPPAPVTPPAPVDVPGGPPVAGKMGQPSKGVTEPILPFGAAPQGPPSLGLGAAQFSPRAGLPVPGLLSSLGLSEVPGGPPGRGIGSDVVASPPPRPPVPPFGAPTVTPEPSPGDPSTWQPMGSELTREMTAQLGPPQAPPPDANAIVRGAEQAAADRAAQPRQPGFLERLSGDPLFHAGLAILGTAPGGNWGPAGVQALQGATRSRREQTEYERLQSRRTVMDRIWREAFGANGQPNASHPLMQGLPPEMASTVFAMGPEDGLPALQRWQMFRGQQEEQRRIRQANLAQFGIGGQPPPASGEDQAGAGLARLQAQAGLPGVGGPPVAGAVPWPGGPAPPPTAPPGGQPGGEPTVRIGNVTMPISQARALATASDEGTRQVITQAIAAAERQGQVPEAIRTRALITDQSYRTITSALGDYVRLVEQAGMSGASWPGTTRDAIMRARTNLLLQLKEMYNLGVLNGPDLALMEGMIPDPTISVSGVVGRGSAADRARAAADQLRRELGRVRENALGAAGMPVPGGGQQPPGTTRLRFNPQTGQIE